MYVVCGAGAFSGSGLLSLAWKLSRTVVELRSHVIPKWDGPIVRQQDIIAVFEEQYHHTCLPLVTHGWGGAIISVRYPRGQSHKTHNQVTKNEAITIYIISIFNGMVGGVLKRSTAALHVWLTAISVLTLGNYMDYHKIT